MRHALKINETDNLMVALQDLRAGQVIQWQGMELRLRTDVPAKHKFTTEDVPVGGGVTMYGTPVGKALRPLLAGEAVTVDNIRHYGRPPGVVPGTPPAWSPPDVSAYAGRTFKGHVRDDGRVGTANYWLVLPLVFCVNRAAQRLADVLGRALGYADNSLGDHARGLTGSPVLAAPPRLFPGLDGVRAITVTGGCGGAASDCETLGRLLAAYADYPNVAGVTVFSLGCEKLQPEAFMQALHKRNPRFRKPVLVYTRQQWAGEADMMRNALEKTLALLPEAASSRRTDVPLSELKIGMKCGGSDGFSGISANPALGLVADWVVALGGAVNLAEFPELYGVEASIADRCVTPAHRERFLEFMQRYERTAGFFGTSMADNPSWGNIHDGLTTDAIKSAGAARKGGSSPIKAVLDYAEPMSVQGLSLTCSPGNDVEAVTAQVAAGCNLILFTTGLGTPTGNPIVPVLKVATNTAMAERLADMIDYDCGPVIEGAPLEETARGLFELTLACAGGDHKAKADRLEQFDFMLWKRSVDL